MLNNLIQATLIMTPLELWMLQLPIETWLKMRITKIALSIIIVGIIGAWLRRRSSFEIRSDSASLPTILGSITGSGSGYYMLLYVFDATPIQLQNGTIMIAIIAFYRSDAHLYIKKMIEEKWSTQAP
ncbi:hypothetical protein KA478_04165 [Patescibacteria group bacterium]|nr:hypothetical protein [Patescibacteria group bacterium]